MSEGGSIERRIMGRGDMEYPHCEILNTPSLADPRIYFGGQTKVPNRKLRAKPESRARSAQVSRTNGEARVEGAKRPRIESESSPNRG